MDMDGSGGIYGGQRDYYCTLDNVKRNKEEYK
jgi:hypothetical protein